MVRWVIEGGREEGSQGAVFSSILKNKNKKRKRKWTRIQGEKEEKEKRRKGENTLKDDKICNVLTRQMSPYTLFENSQK